MANVIENTQAIEVKEVKAAKAPKTEKAKKAIVTKIEKPVKEEKAKAKKAPVKTPEVLLIGNEVLTSKTNRFGATIYQNTLFSDCQSDKDKKHLRIKLRRKLYAFFSDFVTKRKNPTELAKIKKAWQDYSKKVYKDATVIIDSNATEDNRRLAIDFLKAMQ